MLSSTTHRIPSSRGAETVAFDWGGPSDGPVLLFTHAIGLHAHMYTPLVARLRDRYRCIGIDLRAHGHARRPDDGDLAWTGMRDDVLAVIDGLGLAGQPLFGHGHSMGGTAMVCAELDRPGLFRAMVLYEAVLYEPPPGTVAGQPWPNPMGIGARKRRETFASRQAALDNYASKPPFSAVDREALEQYVEHGFVDMPDGSIRLACRAEDEAAVYENSATETFFRLGELRCPMAVLLGESTVEPHLSTVPIYAVLIPGAKFVKATGRSHFGPLEGTDEYAEMVAELLTELGSNAPARP